MATEKIILYTNRRCPFARRAHATLKELGLEYEEIFIDLDKPREQWYLDLNPRGLVPTLKYGNEIITESAIVSEFLVDAYGPNHILPPPTSPQNALFRARAKWLVDTYSTKVQPLWWKIFHAPQDQLPTLAAAYVDAVEKEFEPYLADAKPFFGGSEKLTWVEIQLGSFLLYPKVFAGKDGGDLISQEQVQRLKGLKNFGPWWERLTEHPTILDVFDQEGTVKAGLQRREKALKAAEEKK